MFQLNHKGFSLKFDNGVTVSVAWGTGNYCARRYEKDSDKPSDMNSVTAEVLAWRMKDGAVEDIGNPSGWVKPDEIPALLEKYRALPAV